MRETCRATIEEKEVLSFFQSKLGYLGVLLIYLGGLLVYFNICIPSVLGLVTYTEPTDQANKKPNKNLCFHKSLRVPSHKPLFWPVKENEYRKSSTVLILLPWHKIIIPYMNFHYICHQNHIQQVKPKHRHGRLKTLMASSFKRG